MLAAQKTAMSRIIALGSPLLVVLLFGNACHGLVETCGELKAAFDLTKTQDVVIQIHPFTQIDCGTFTTMSMDSNSLTVEISEPFVNDLTHVDLTEVRFEVTNGATLTWEPVAVFRGTVEQDVNGGGVFVGEGSTVRFLNDLSMFDVGVRSVAEDGVDFATYELSGGCVYTDGYFRVDGEAEFTRCEVSGGGEAPPGPGGVLYVGEKGSVLFNDKLEMSEVGILDNEGNDGAGIYNKGKVNIKGDAVFNRLGAVAGGAIFNAVGAQFLFRSGATVLFTDCGAEDGKGGSLYNEGYFKFSGAALFVKSGVVVVASEGELALSSDSVFWATGDTFNPAVIVEAGGDLQVPGSVLFFENDDADCSTVFYQEDETCSP